MSYKDMVELLSAIRGLPLSKARQMLSDVIERQRPISYKVHSGKVGHKPGMGAGRYPAKAAKELLRVLENAEANAEFKGLDTNRLWIVHAVVHKGPKIRSYTPRAFGRATPWYRQLVHVEIGVEERA